MQFWFAGGRQRTNVLARIIDIGSEVLVVISGSRRLLQCGRTLRSLSIGLAGGPSKTGVPRPSFAWAGRAKDSVGTKRAQANVGGWPTRKLGCPVLALLGRAGIFVIDPPRRYDGFPMPSGLRRFQQTGQMHFVTFSCYRRQPKLSSPQARSVFERSLERTRRAYGFCVAGRASGIMRPDTGWEGAVEIESEWTARRREQAGLRPTVLSGARVQFPPKQSLDGAPP